ncbi:ankyrin repeat family protein [Rhynchospora pubera]|uniref:Ankyrin repeat family protein n=1 Tax=Rhynchospora pubera TaxID=906938 RepID=A0AAV8BNY5_9POAL|nr:ankyrin repeat family protein [Rhynchospora pubera]
MAASHFSRWEAEVFTQALFTFPRSNSFALSPTSRRHRKLAHLLQEVAKEFSQGRPITDRIKAIEHNFGNGHSAFHLSAFYGRTDLCQYFVQHLGFHVDLLSPTGESPLFHAARTGQEATARYLISRGANPAVSNMLGMTPLHCAVRYAQDHLVRFFLSLGVPVDVKFNHSTGTPLTVAALFGQASTIKILLEHHADVSCAKINGCTPLFLSISAGQFLHAKLLIKVGADLNLKCPLARAIPTVEATEIVPCLLEAGADPNLRNEYGWLPIEIAAMCKKRDFVEMLFPLTSPVPDVHDWSVQGILQYVQSHAFKEKNEEILEKNLADLKVKGADSFKKKEYQAAICFYTEAILLDSMIGSGDATLFSNRSLCFHQMGEGDMAMMDALIAQRVKPDWPKAHYRLGAAFMLLDDYDEASGAFEEGLRLDPANIEMKKAHREALDCLRKSHFGE